MVDLSSVSIGIQSLKTAIDIAKELRNVDSLIKDAEVKLKIAELIGALSDAKVALAEANDEILDLKREIASLQQSLSKKQEIEFRDGLYYAANPKQGEAPGPFCPNCYSADNKLILLSELPIDMRDFGKYNCAKCNFLGG